MRECSILLLTILTEIRFSRHARSLWILNYYFACDESLNLKCTAISSHDLEQHWDLEDDTHYLEICTTKGKKSSFGLCYSLLFNFTFFVSGKLYNYSNILLIIWDWISVNLRQEWNFLACWWYLDSEMTVNCCFYRIFGAITDTKRIADIVFRRVSY